MYIQIPMYLVTLGAGFLFAVIKYFVPSIPVTADQIAWLILTILALLNVDVTQALYRGRSVR